MGPIQEQTALCKQEKVPFLPQTQQPRLVKPFAVINAYIIFLRFFPTVSIEFVTWDLMLLPLPGNDTCFNNQ
jgi:hypothetical protein